MSFTRIGTPQPIQTCEFVLDDAQSIRCECGGMIGTISHGVIKTCDGVPMVSIGGMRCSRCLKIIDNGGEKNGLDQGF